MSAGRHRGRHPADRRLNAVVIQVPTFTEQGLALPVEVMRHRGFGHPEGRYSDIAAGVVWAAEHGARVIALPLSGTRDSGLLRDAVEYADAHGNVVVTAAGNATSSAHSAPEAGVDDPGLEGDRRGGNVRTSTRVVTAAR